MVAENRIYFMNNQGFDQLCFPKEGVKSDNSQVYFWVYKVLNSPMGISFTENLEQPEQGGNETMFNFLKGN